MTRRSARWCSPAAVNVRFGDRSLSRPGAGLGRQRSFRVGAAAGVLLSPLLCGSPSDRPDKRVIFPAEFSGHRAATEIAASHRLPAARGRRPALIGEEGRRRPPARQRAWAEGAGLLRLVKTRDSGCGMRARLRGLRSDVLGRLLAAGGCDPGDAVPAGPMDRFMVLVELRPDAGKSTERRRFDRPPVAGRQPGDARERQIVSRQPPATARPVGEAQQQRGFEHRRRCCCQGVRVADHPPWEAISVHALSGAIPRRGKQAPPSWHVHAVVTALRLRVLASPQRIASRRGSRREETAMRGR